MSKNIDQVFTANPITTNAGTDLMYFGQSPYGAGNDAAMLFSNFQAQFGAPFTPAALTEANDTNVTLTLGGTPATALLQATSITAGWTGTLAGSRGGLGAAITASNGGIYYSNATNGALLAGTATANQVLLSGASTTPAWSTATYPATTTINQLLYSSSANTIAGLTTATTAVLTTVAGVPTWAAELSLALGGTNANLTASNGGIFYSTASAGAILAGTATAGQILISGASTTPSWLAAGGGGTLVRSAGTAWAASTTTLANSFSINTIVYAASANNLSGLATANSSILVTNGTGVPSWSTSIPSGISPFTTVDQASSSVTMAINTQYVIDNGASLVTLTLPATAAEGAIFRVIGMSSGGWKIGQAASQTCHVGSSATTAGTGGSIASTNQYDSIELVCVVANTTFVAISMIGNLTIV